MNSDSDSEPDSHSHSRQEALLLKALAETKFKSSNLKSALKYAKRAQRLCPSLEGLADMVTAFTILGVASKSPPDYYRILQVEPFSHINTIRKHYKKLALALHPDKNPNLGSEDAFKHVVGAFKFLSDRVKRKEYDVGLRLRMQEEAVEGLGSDGVARTFWTACSRCRLLHQFERKYLGHSLVCPNCKKSFKAVEVEANERHGEDIGGEDRRDRSERKVNDSSVGRGGSSSKRKLGSEKRLQNHVKLNEKVGGGEWSGTRLRSRRGSRVKRGGGVDDTVKRSEKEQGAETGEEMMTLAQMQLEMKRKLNREKEKSKERDKEKEQSEKDDGVVLPQKDTDEGQMEKDDRGAQVQKDSNKDRRSLSKKGSASEVESHLVSDKNGDLVIGTRSSKRRILEIKRKDNLEKGKVLEIVEHTTVQKKNASSRVEKPRSLKSKDLEVMTVVDSDFYDFDKDRVERSFRKGQVWAIYDDIDGQPRNYGLITEVMCPNPFEVRLSWLDIQDSAAHDLVGLHVACGRFKVSRETSVRSVNIFSHVVDCERAAREIYRIYPKKGSVWAVYNERVIDAEARNLLDVDDRHYDIIICLTTYSEMHGLSVAYLEKVDGYKTVFKRREIGLHAVRWLEKDELDCFSHEIPSRRLSGSEVPGDLSDCWELDPASLPSRLLTIQY